jgi:hypothetical protein
MICKGLTPHLVLYYEKKDVSIFLAVACRSWVYLGKQRQENGMHTPRAMEAVYVGFQIKLAHAFFVTE